MKDRNERQMVDRLNAALGQRLISVVAYGPSAHDDDYSVVGEHLLIVTRDLELETLRLLGEPVQWWLSRGEPWPRLVTPQLVRDAVDVFPLELLDITSHRRVIHGPDTLAGLVIERDQLRLQCERELREKLMRLREGYVEARNATMLRALLASSFPDFVRIFRGCLHLLGAPLARHDHDVVATLCKALDLSPYALGAVERIARGERTDDPEVLFASYYRALTVAEERIDRLIIRQGRPT